MSQLSSLRTGISGLAAVPALHFPLQDDSLLESQRLASTSGHQSSAFALSSSSAAAAATAAAQHPDESSALSSASAPHTSQGSLVMHLLSDSALAELAKQQPAVQPAALRHASPSTVVFGRGSMQQRVEDTSEQSGAEGSSATQTINPGGSRRRKKSRHPADPAMQHIEDHLQILKHVYVKHASPR